MLAAAWVLAGATIVIALAAPVAIITWRQTSLREREQQARERALEQGRKEFASKDALWGAVAAVAFIGLLAYGNPRKGA